MSPRCPIFSTSWVSITCTTYPLPSDHVRQERHLAGALDRGRGLPLMLRAERGDPPGPDLAAVRGEPPQHAVVLVVHVSYVLLAEHARLVLRRACPAGKTAPSPTHSKPPVLLPVSARGLGGLREWPVGVRRRELHDHVPEHVVGDAQDALELHQGTLAGGKLHHHVVAGRPVVYLVGQLPPAPVVGVPRLAAGALDDRAERRDRVLGLLLVELGDDYEHGFVNVQVRLLWSLAASSSQRSCLGEAGAHEIAAIVYQRDKVVTNPVVSRNQRP